MPLGGDRRVFTVPVLAFVILYIFIIDSDLSKSVTVEARFWHGRCLVADCTFPSRDVSCPWHKPQPKRHSGCRPHGAGRRKPRSGSGVGQVSPVTLSSCVARTRSRHVWPSDCFRSVVPRPWCVWCRPTTGGAIARSYRGHLKHGRVLWVVADAEPNAACDAD